MLLLSRDGFTQFLPLVVLVGELSFVHLLSDFVDEVDLSVPYLLLNRRHTIPHLFEFLLTLDLLPLEIRSSFESIFVEII